MEGLLHLPLPRPLPTFAHFPDLAITCMTSEADY